jgi:DNA repair photolyase
LEVKDLFVEWLETHHPTEAARVLGLIKETREGKLYYSEFGVRMSGTGRYAELLAKRFQVACRRLRLNIERPRLDATRFCVPPRKGEQTKLL